MHVSKYIENAGKEGGTIFSLEVLPPIRGEGIEKLFTALDPLAELKPSFINVTYHYQEITRTIDSDGFPIVKLVRKRPGTIGVCASIQNRYRIETVGHLIASQLSKQAIEDILLDMHYLGINNVLALKGDDDKELTPKTKGDAPLKNPPSNQSDTNGVVREEIHRYAIDLVRQIQNLNKGIILQKDSLYSKKETFHTSFEIGVAGYPEKHSLAPDLDTDIMRLKEKVDAGAKYIVTQMFFDNRHYYHFVEKCRASGITCPIVPGIKPLSTYAHLTKLPEMFHCQLPDTMKKELEKIKHDKQKIFDFGIEWSIAQVKDLIKNNVPCIHFFTMSSGKNVLEILRNVF